MSSVRKGPMTFEAKLDRVITTDLEPGCGVTIVIDLGDMPERVEKLERYMCMQVPRSELRALGEAPEAPRGTA